MESLRRESVLRPPPGCAPAFEISSATARLVDLALPNGPPDQSARAAMETVMASAPACPFLSSRPPRICRSERRAEVYAHVIQELTPTVAAMFARSSRTDLAGEGR